MGDLMTKTLDDALSAPGVIPEGRYRMEEGFDIFSHIGGDKNEVRLNGRFVPEELRRIADHLDPQADNVAAIRAEARREALEEAAKVADGWLKLCRGVSIDVVSAETYAVSAVEDIADNIRALIEQEPTS
jgi:hypothetical protein